MLDSGSSSYVLRGRGSSWKSSIDIFSVKKADEFNGVLCYLHSESIISDLDTVILLITLDFPDAL